MNICQIFLLGGILLGHDLYSQEFMLDEYREVYEIVSRDTVLAKEFCSGDSLKLAVHPRFDYLSISSFRSIFPDLKFSETEMKQMARMDKIHSKNQEKLSYLFMTDQFYALFDHHDLPCAIICFDHPNGNLIMAQVSRYGVGLDWNVVTSNGPLYYLLFDTRKHPYKYIKLRVFR